MLMSALYTSVECGWCDGTGALTTGEPCAECRGTGLVAAAEDEPPAVWVRPAGYEGPCPECGSSSCGGYYRPDANHFLAF